MNKFDWCERCALRATECECGLPSEGQEISQAAGPDYNRLHDTNLAQVLDDVAGFLGQYVAFPTAQARVATVLWIAHTWVVGSFESTPRLHVKSAEKGSGKTRLLEAIELLVREPLAAANATTAALFRSIGDGVPPTVMLDEVDTIFGPKAPEGAEDLRGLINAGHRKGKPILRCSGPTHEVREFPSFAPMALAGIGDIPDTVEDRSITVRMRRRAPDETVRPFRHREAAAEAAPIRDAFSELAPALEDRLHGWYPPLPSWLTDRPADVWEPCIAIAAIAGPDWERAALDACAVLLAERTGTDASLGVRLLQDIRHVLGDDATILTDDLLLRLHALDESPWGEWAITARWLANHLRPYGITSKNIRKGDKQAKGYAREAFADPWSRYLAEDPSQPSQAPDQPKPGIESVPGTDATVPTSRPQASDQHRDGGTHGTPTRAKLS